METEHSSEERHLLIGSPPLTLKPRGQINPVFYIYSILFLYTFGEYLQPAPRAQLYESIICQKYYSDIGSLGPAHQDCKTQAVQEELVLLRGIERLTELAPCTFFLSRL